MKAAAAALALAAALVVAACGAPGPGDRAPAQPLTPTSLPAFFDCLHERGAVMVSAHRGGPSPGYAENATATFEHTLSLAPTFLEVDVARTRDSELVLMHDDKVDRTTNGAGSVGDLTLRMIQALRLRDDGGAVLEDGPPSLQDALDWARTRAVLELDIKQGVRYEDVVREVRASEAMHRVVFITYSPRGAIRLARLAPDAMIYTTIERRSDLDEMARRGVDLTHVVAWLGTEGPDTALLAALAARGVESRVGAFGPNPDFGSLARSGVQGVSANDAVGAYRAFDAADDIDGYEALQCAGAE